ncbi:winged helix-turn-helix transcriptional regulator [Amycolatopsis sp. H20-H5]|uniref:winged helix-turn-helix transcriptional regulator n=1 Tax=Amycolatopsis sp. H20-H5 TaxID=3046309 RepID=UPI002DB9DF60|nr:helix-turn-helix domain-containing protein [Amycolatopsis sp. H20-H5]MEC3981699.1 helix-turn-helix domain-containing protein [Amycolatopsis sp. H20-H5]
MLSGDDLQHRFEADSVNRALAIVGERWSLLILRETLFGVRRYSEFARNLSIPRPTLSARLKLLVEAGLLDRVRYATDPDRHEYRLTQAGRDLFPAIVVLMRWGDKYLAGPEGPPMLLRHNDCGEIADAYVACRHCGGEITVEKVTPEAGPGYRHD